MKMLTITLLITAIYGNSAVAAQVDVDQIEQAAQQLDSKTLLTMSQTTSGFDKALANYRLAVTSQLSDKLEEAKAYLLTAEEILTHEGEPKTADHYALLAQIYGYHIALSPMKGALYGPKSASALNKAFSLDSENPRAHFVAGVSKYNTPALFGGSKKSALSAFDGAINRYSDNDTSGFNWGNAEAFVWRGLTHLALNDVEKAKADWQSALLIAPNYGWPKMLLANN